MSLRSPLSCITSKSAGSDQEAGPIKRFESVARIRIASCPAFVKVLVVHKNNAASCVSFFHRRGAEERSRGHLSLSALPRRPLLLCGELSITFLALPGSFLCLPTHSLQKWLCNVFGKPRRVDNPRACRYCLPFRFLILGQRQTVDLHTHNLTASATACTMCGALAMCCCCCCPPHSRWNQSPVLVIIST